MPSLTIHIFKNVATWGLQQAASRNIFFVFFKKIMFTLVQLRPQRKSTKKCTYSKLQHTVKCLLPLHFDAPLSRSHSYELVMRGQLTMLETKSSLYDYSIVYISKFYCTSTTTYLKEGGGRGEGTRQEEGSLFPSLKDPCLCLLGCGGFVKILHPSIYPAPSLLLLWEIFAHLFPSAGHVKIRKEGGRTTKRHAESSLLVQRLFFFLGAVIRTKI